MMKTVTTDMRHRIRIRIKTDDDKHTHRLNRNEGMPLRLVYMDVICPKVINQDNLFMLSSCMDLSIASRKAMMTCSL